MTELTKDEVEAIEREEFEKEYPPAKEKRADTVSELDYDQPYNRYWSGWLARARQPAPAPEPVAEADIVNSVTYWPHHLNLPDGTYQLFLHPPAPAAGWQKDAERYRFLRSDYAADDAKELIGVCRWSQESPALEEGPQLVVLEELDALVDAAMLPEPPK